MITEASLAEYMVNKAAHCDKHWSACLCEHQRVWEIEKIHALLVFLDSKGVVQKTKYGQGRSFWDCQRLPGVS
jgi:hypothetical protein